MHRILLPLLLALLALPAVAQPNPTPIQLEAWQNLSSDERARLMREHGSGVIPSSGPVSLPDDPAGLQPRAPVRSTSDADRPLDAHVVIKPGDTLILEIAGDAPSALRGRRVVQVDSEGRVRLPVLDRVMLADLTGHQAAEWLGAESSLRDAQIRVEVMPVRRSGLARLEPFGYDLFRDAPTTFAPTTAIPVPRDYVLGPGDILNVQLFGKESGLFGLEITREGQVLFPQLGPIGIAGLSFGDAQALLVQRVEEQMIGVQAHVTMGPLRTIRVFVLGEATRPGAYTVSALTSATHALMVSGGVRQSGSLRKIEIRRGGETVSTLDIYDLLLRGDTRGDQRLQADDVVFIPPAGPQVAIDGEVRRPAIYELREERTAEQLVALAGGLQPTAYPTLSRLERIVSAQGERELAVLDLTTASGRATQLRTGDYLSIASVLDRIDGTVRVTGHVQRPLVREWRAGQRISDLVPDLGTLLPAPDLSYALLRRETEPLRRVQVMVVDLGAILGAPRGAADIELQRNDEVLVFGLDELDERRGRIDRVVESIRLQATFERPPEVVDISGPVRAPGAYPLQPGMRLSELVLRAGSGLDTLSRPDYGYALIRRETGPTRRVSVESVPLQGALDTPGSDADPTLQPLDRVLLFSLAEVDDRRSRLDEVIATLRAQATSEQPFKAVLVNGRVNAAGQYPLEPGMRLSHLLRAAGGLAESAYLLNAEVTRVEIVAGDEQRMTHFAVDLEALRSGNLEHDPELHLRDVVNIKPKPYWGEVATIELRGEVRFPGTYSLLRNELLSAVIERAGGLTPDAYPNGSVFMRQDLRRREQREIDRMADRIELEIATASTSTDDDTTRSQQIIDARELAQRLRTTEAAGRLVINLELALARAGDPASDVRVEDGDILVIPTRPQEVTVIGEVYFPTSHYWAARQRPGSYIELSGGTTKRADNRAIYIVKADGRVIPLRRMRTMDPGDTIIVPLNPDQVSRLTLWTNISTIFYQIGIAAAAWRTVGVF